LRGQRVVVIDESVETREMLRLMLAHAGFVPVVAESVYRARLELGYGEAGERTPVFVVSSEAIGEAGAESRRQLAEIFESARAIVTCAQQGSGRCRVFSNLPCGRYLDCLGKPFTYRQLLERIGAV